MKKALILQLSRLGDLLQATVLLNSLKNNGYKIYLLGDEKNIQIASEIDLIDRFIPLKIGTLLKNISQNNLSTAFNEIEDIVTFLNKEKFDILINLNHSKINFYLSNIIKAKKKRGFKLEKNKFVDFIYSQIKTNRKNNFYNLVDIFNFFCEKPTISKKLFINKNIEDNNIKFVNKILKQDNNIIFHLGAGHPLRQWDIKKFAQTANLILKDINTTITLTGTKNEVPLGRDFKKYILPEFHSQIINLMGKTDIPTLKALILKSNLLLSTDTGIMHLAAACGINIISLFYASAFVYETGPYTEKAFILSPVKDCYPCTEFFQQCKDYNCKDKIEPEDIFLCVKYFLNLIDCNELKNFFLKKSNSVTLYLPEFDKFGIFFQNIVKYNKNIVKEREKGFKLCLKKI